MAHTYIHFKELQVLFGRHTLSVTDSWGEWGTKPKPITFRIGAINIQFYLEITGSMLPSPSNNVFGTTSITDIQFAANTANALKTLLYRKHTHVHIHTEVLQ